MVIEFVINRGWRIWIDGAQPGTTWDVGESNDDPLPIYYLSRGAEPLRVGEHTISAVQFDVPETEWCEDTPPRSAKMYIDGKLVEGRVVACGWGSEDEGPLTATLFDGEEIELDEITAYVRIQVQE